MIRIGIAVIAGFLVTFVVASLLAVFVLQPWVNADLAGYVRTMEQGLHLPSILAGYFVLAAVMTGLYPRVNLNEHWLWNGLLFGLTVGVAVFVAGHLIISGWSVIPAKPMLLSGLVDTLAPALGGIAIAFVYRNRNY